MFAYSVLVVVLLSGVASAFLAPVSSRCHISRSSLAMADSKAAPKIATGAYNLTKITVALPIRLSLAPFNDIRNSKFAQDFLHCFPALPS
jgi:hypothetical protein